MVLYFVVEVKFEVRQLHHLVQFGTACKSATIRGIEFYFVAYVVFRLQFGFDLFESHILLQFIAVASKLQLKLVTEVVLALFEHEEAICQMN